MSKENISIETESFEKEGEQVRIRCSPSNNCIVNHLVLEQIASLLSCHRHRVKYISHSTNNLYITTRFFFFFLLSFSLLGEIWSTRVLALAVRRHHALGNLYRDGDIIMASYRGKETNAVEGRKEGEELCQRRRGCNTAHGNRNPGRAGRPRQLVSST